MFDIMWRSLQWKSLQGKTMFHPKAAELPDGSIVMTLQEIFGGDYYGEVMSASSADRGRHWSDVKFIPPLGWRALGNPGESEGVCDTVPDYDPASGRLVAVGHNVYYRENRFWDTFGTWDASDRNTDLKRRGCYSVRREDGSWTPRQYFDPEEFKDAVAFCCGCTQKVVRDNGEWLLPFYFMKDTAEHTNRVVVYRAKFDGERFELLERGNIMENLVKRGIMEPSLIDYNGKVYITLRAEDGNGYWAVAEDGINFSPLKPWEFDNGEKFETDTTQQHYLKIGGRLFLSYTRNAGFNQNIMRFRAPLFIAEIDPETTKLKRDTEQTVFPDDGDWEVPDTVAKSGNFHPLMLKDGSAMIFDGSIRSCDCSGIIMLAHLKLK